MIAGGLGNVRRMHALKGDVPLGAKLVVLGGPAMLIGLGGGASSSMDSGASTADLDFASVQRGNAEVQAARAGGDRRLLGARGRKPDRAHPRRRRWRSVERHSRGRRGKVHAARESTCAPYRARNPACRRCRSGATKAGALRRAAVVFCRQARSLCAAFAARERCPFAVIGEIDASGQLVVHDPLFGDEPVDMPIDVLLGRTPRMRRDVRSVDRKTRPSDSARADLREAAYRVLGAPAVADKTFLITIGDRTAGWPRQP